MPFCQKTVFFIDLYLDSKEATAIIFILGIRGYPPVLFEYRKAFEGYLLAEIKAEQYLVGYIWKISVLQF